MDQSTFGLRDAVVAGLGLLTASMGWIFKRQDHRITNLEDNKVDKTALDDKFKEVIRRLDAQDISSQSRDTKLDRLIEKLIK
jgi:hypothetical protein